MWCNSSLMQRMTSQLEKAIRVVSSKTLDILHFFSGGGVMMPTLYFDDFLYQMIQVEAQESPTMN